MSNGSPRPPAPASLPCAECGGLPVVQFERAGRPATGAHTVCADCNGEGVARCFWRIVCRSAVATQTVDSRPACEACALELAKDDLDVANAHPAQSLARTSATAGKAGAA